jgi:hypothetical protein
MSKLHLVVARARHASHDCDRCQLVGIKSGADLYFCPIGNGTYIARRSSEGSDYISTGLDIVKALGAKVSPLIWEAHQRHLALREMLGLSEP